MRCPILAIPLSLFVLWAAPAIAQTKLQAVKSWTCPPGQTTRLTIDGQGLDDSLRFLASSPTVELEIESLSASQAVLQLTVPKDAPRGPMALWAASAAGPLPPQVLLVDELPAVADNGKNHTWAAAQSLATPCAVEGRCDGSASDFYRFTVTAGQRLAFEIHTQGLQSAMDPVVRLLGADGTPLRVVDDSLVGPDGRFSHTFAAAGEFGLQIQDSRHAAAGSPYHLRLGDFPLLSHCMPLAVSPGERTLIKFYGPDSQRVADQMVEIPADSTSRQWSVAVRFPEGVASSWLPLRIQTHASYVEPQTNPPATPPAATAASPATATTSQGESTAGAASAESQRAEERLLVSANQPLGISGHLGQPQEIDRYCLQGVAGQRVRVTARARSLGLPTLLNMSLQNTSGNVVAHTTVGEEDEWSFEFTFPDDAEYQLEVSDLLHRGGEEFGYWIEVAPAASFALSFAAAATSRQQFAIAEQQGACAVDLEIDRRGGYEGAIDVSLVEAIPSVKIMNAHISA
ncbi:MAG: hypothetical protein KDA45_16450, partial [Planctomycetales bacterium]|nr:hypothetical protein [Planctomycetales bacterium]